MTCTTVLSYKLFDNRRRRRWYYYITEKIQNDIPKKEVKHGKVLDYNSNVVVVILT